MAPPMSRLSASLTQSSGSDTVRGENTGAEAPMWWAPYGRAVAGCLVNEPVAPRVEADNMVHAGASGR